MKFFKFITLWNLFFTAIILIAFFGYEFFYQREVFDKESRVFVENLANIDGKTVEMFFDEKISDSNIILELPFFKKAIYDYYREGQNLLIFDEKDSQTLKDINKYKEFEEVFLINNDKKIIWSLNDNFVGENADNLKSKNSYFYLAYERAKVDNETSFFSWASEDKKLFFIYSPLFIDSEFAGLLLYQVKSGGARYAITYYNQINSFYIVDREGNLFIGSDYFSEKINNINTKNCFSKIGFSGSYENHFLKEVYGSNYYLEDEDLCLIIEVDYSIAQPVFSFMRQVRCLFVFISFFWILSFFLTYLFTKRERPVEND